MTTDKGITLARSPHSRVSLSTMMIALTAACTTDYPHVVSTVVSSLDATGVCEEARPYANTGNDASAVIQLCY